MQCWYKSFSSAALPRHGVPKISDLAPNAAKFAGHKDKVRVVSVDKIVQLLFRQADAKQHDRSRQAMRMKHLLS